MIVKDLIEDLKTCNPESKIVLITGINGDADEYELDLVDDDDNGKVRLECDELCKHMEYIARPELIEEENK